MNIESYTNQQAMDKVHLTSRSAFYHLKRKFPQAFVVLKRSLESGNATVYDKQALDKFVEKTKSLK